MAFKLETQRMQAHVEGGIGWMIFNNPARHNALSLEMWQGISDILQHFTENDDVRVVVMRGAGGKAFVSGADISEFDDKRSNAEQERAYGKISGQATRWLNHLEKPLIALIEGYCIGGGLATALAADIRIASADSKFGIPAAKLGLGYGYEGLAKLARVVGPSHARDIMFSARFFDSSEAMHMGLINFVEDRDDIEEKCLAYAQRIAANAPLTVRAAKAAVNAWEAGTKESDVALVREMVEVCFNSADYEEGRSAFAQKRTPKFRGH
ncbi:MAG: enoyl-CoA hydratase [Gammaproteobacteria bacterium]|nr:enoyl-CoA hydratase [Gammaproteobacteria bacterium]